MKNILLYEKSIQDESLHHVYQPLYFLSDWSIAGYEALLRSKYFKTPDLMFKHADTINKLYDLDTLSLFKAIMFYASKRKNSHALLFINVFPSTLLHPNFYQFIEKIIACEHISNRKIVLEINESQEVPDISSMRDAIALLRKNGFRIALDDVGRGYDSLKSLIELEPDFVKLDRYFSQGLSTSVNKQKLVQLFVDYCKPGTRLILEGIEKSEELATAKLLGIDIGQGYLLGKPNDIT